jgi:hypothetical protein
MLLLANPTDDAYMCAILKGDLVSSSAALVCPFLDDQSQSYALRRTSIMWQMLEED